MNGAAICGSLAEVYQRIVHVVKEVRNRSDIDTIEGKVIVAVVFVGIVIFIIIIIDVPAVVTVITVVVVVVVVANTVVHFAVRPQDGEIKTLCALEAVWWNANSQAYLTTFD